MADGRAAAAMEGHLTTVPAAAAEQGEPVELGYLFGHAYVKSRSPASSPLAETARARYSGALTGTVPVSDDAIRLQTAPGQAQMSTSVRRS